MTVSKGGVAWKGCSDSASHMEQCVMTELHWIKTAGAIVELGKCAHSGAGWFNVVSEVIVSTPKQ